MPNDRTPKDHIQHDSTQQDVRPSGLRPGRLVLEDGSVFRGTAFGSAGVTTAAEVVFNTAMCGYQESLTDPSYTAQILVETFPLIGNYGVNDEDVEGWRVSVSGFVVRELSRLHSNFRATGGLDPYLAAAGVLGIAGVDTRAITLKLREHGAMRGVVSDEAGLSDGELLARVRSAPAMAGADLVSGLERSPESAWAEDLGPWSTRGGDEPAGRRLRVLTIDCGAKQNILRHLVDRGGEVVLVPPTVSATEIIAMAERGEIDGVFLSNGPGDPAAVEALVATLTELLARDEPPVPIFGICLGHQLLARSLGAETYKLKFGHRGANQPVLDRSAGRVQITSQNHGFAVEAESLEKSGGAITHSHLNDGTVAGFEARGGMVFGVQHHPEASPGPHDAAVVFDRFVSAMRSRTSV